MLNRTLEKLEFILNNLYTSTNAVGLAIFDETGTIAAECGNLDTDVMSDNAARVILNADSLLALFAGKGSEPFSLWIDGARGSAMLAPVSKNLFLMIFYPKDVDIFYIKDNIGKFTADVRSALVSLEPYAKE
jgi:predicted regulator of Ras-like GTPase activity (Roadblock/LC7/MglB family)